MFPTNEPYHNQLDIVRALDEQARDLENLKKAHIRQVWILGLFMWIMDICMLLMAYKIHTIRNS